MIEREDGTFDQPIALAFKQHLDGILRGQPDQRREMPGDRRGSETVVIIAL